MALPAPWPRLGAHLFAWVLLAVWCAASPALWAQEKQRIAVLELAHEGARQEAEAIAEELRKTLVKSGRYVVIDRTLTAQILKEWETQQSGLTDSEKAVKIGRLFNVQLIVTGKLNKFSSGGWQVSVVMLDAQSGVTNKAETVRHRGDFFSLLDEKVPSLGVALVGTSLAPQPPASPPATAASAPPATSAVPATQAEVKKLAIYPAFYSGEYGEKLEDSHDRIIAGIRKLVNEIFAGEIEIAREFASLRDTGGEKNDYISDGAWKGFFSKEPDEQFVYKSAREIGANLVLMYETTVPGGGRGKHNVYLFDADSMRSFKQSTKWKKGKLGTRLKQAIRFVLEDYRLKR